MGRTRIMNEADEKCVSDFCRKGNIKMDLWETVLRAVGCIQLAEDGDRWRALADKAMNFRVPRGRGDLLSSLATKRFSATLS